MAADPNIISAALSRGYTLDEIADKLSAASGLDPSVIRERGYSSQEILARLGYPSAQVGGEDVFAKPDKHGINFDAEGQPIPVGMNTTADRVAAGLLSQDNQNRHEDTQDGQARISELLTRNDTHVAPTIENAEKLKPLSPEEVAADTYQTAAAKPRSLETNPTEAYVDQVIKSAQQSIAAKGGPFSEAMPEPVARVTNQFVWNAIDASTAGIAEHAIPSFKDMNDEPQNAAEGLAAGVGNFVGFLVSPATKASFGAAGLIDGLKVIGGESMLKAVAKDVTHQAIGLGLASGGASIGQALNADNPVDAAKIIAAHAESGAGVGAIFGAVGRVLPDNTISQIAARVLGGTSLLDVAGGQSPTDTLGILYGAATGENIDSKVVADKAFSFLQNAFFMGRGAGRTRGGLLTDENSKQIIAPPTVDKILSPDNATVDDAIKATYDYLNQGSNFIAQSHKEAENGADNRPDYTEPILPSVPGRDSQHGSVDDALIRSATRSVGGRPDSAGAESGNEKTGSIPSSGTALRAGLPDEIQQTLHGTGEKAQLERRTDLGGRAAFDDALYNRAVDVVNQVGRASVSLIQRNLGIDYGRADNIIKRMEEDGLISAANIAGRHELIKQGEQNAIQEQSAASILQREQGQAGEPGSERGGMESGQQESETSAASRSVGKPETKKETLLNVGLNTNDGKGITEDQVKKELDNLGVSVLRSSIQQSDTEPTFAARLSRPLTPEEAHQLSIDLNQEAIAQTVGGNGELYGPKADDWRPFNRDYFLTPEGKHPLKNGEVGELVGTHFSQEQRQQLRGEFFGKGIKSEEARRVAESDDPRLKSRLSFYVGVEGKDVVAEHGLGKAKHEVKLTNLYDASKNPLRLPYDSSNDGKNRFESAVLDAGFDGYYIPGEDGKQGNAVLLGDAAKSITPKNTPQRSAKPEVKTLIQDIKQMGGVDINELHDITGETRIGKGIIGIPPAFFTKQGRGLDDLATMLKDKGYDIDTHAVDGGVEQLRGMIRDSLDGTYNHTPMENQFSEFERMYREGTTESQNSVSERSLTEHHNAKLVDRLIGLEKASVTSHEALGIMPRGMRKAAQKMMDRADEGKRGGLVFGTEEENNLRAAEMLAKRNGTTPKAELKHLQSMNSMSGGINRKFNLGYIYVPSLDEALKVATERGGEIGKETNKGWQISIPMTHEEVSKLPPEDQINTATVFSKGNKVNGFYHPDIGTTFINTDNAHVKDIPAIILHEVMHAANDDTLNAEVMKRLKIAPVSQFENDMRQQEATLEKVASDRGHASVDDFAKRDPSEFASVTQNWRDHHPMNSISGKTEEIKIGGDRESSDYSIKERQTGGYVARIGKEAANFSNWEDANKWLNERLQSAQQGFTITPELRAKVLNEGLPLFSKNGEPTGDIYARVRARMDQAGETGNAKEATSYLVEEAMKMGQTAGHSRMDTGFWAWAQKTLPPSVVRVLKQWVANVRAAMFRSGVILKESDLSIDDFVAVAQANMRDIASGKKEVSKDGEKISGSEEIKKQTNTPEFKKWFGDSKVVDADGKPLIVYHGTGESFNNFQVSRNGIYFFSTDPYFAGDFAEHSAENIGYEKNEEAGGANIIPAYLSVKKPWDFRKANDRKALLDALPEYFKKDGSYISQLKIGEYITLEDNDYAIPAIKSLGYDGIVVAEGDGTINYGVFTPTQIKSAIGNRGTFDKNNPDIRYSKSRLVINKNEDDNIKEVPLTKKASGVLSAIKTGFTELKDSYSHYPEFTEGKRIVGAYTGRMQEIDFELSKLAKTINLIAPKSRQIAMTNYKQAGGDEAILRERAEKSSGKYRQGYLDALTLTPAEKATVDSIKAYEDKFVKQAIDAGILEHVVDNYVRGQWERENAAGEKLLSLVNSGVLNDHPREAMKKVFANYFEGEQIGAVPVDKRIGFQFIAAQRSIQQAIAARKALTELMHSKEKDGRPTVSVGGAGTIIGEGSEDKPYFVKPNVRGKETGDYRYLDHPSLRRWKWVGEDVNGKPILMQGDMWIHPDAFPQMKALLGRSAVRAYTVPKDVPIIGGTKPFAAMLNAGAFVKGTILLGPFHQFHLAEHAVFHSTNPFNTPEIDFDKRPLLRELASHGLMLYNHNAMHEFSEGLASGGLLHRIPGIGNVLTTYQEWLFQNYIPRLKAAMAEHAVARAEKYYAKDLASGKFTRDQLLENVSKQANAAFGEQNYKYMGRDPSVQDRLRLLLLAPDFLESRFKFAGQAVLPKGKEQAMALLRGAVIMSLGAQTINMMFGDDHKAHWDTPFSAIIGGREYSPRSVVADIHHLYADPSGFWYNRINPLWGKPTLELITGRDQYWQKETREEAAYNILKSWIPIPIQGAMKNKSGQTQLQGIVSTMLGSIGVTNFQHRTEAEKEIRNIAFGHRTIAGDTADKKKQYRDYADLLDDYQSGKLNSMDDVMSKARAGGLILSKGQIKRIAMSRDTSPEGQRLATESRMKSFTAEEVLKVWEKMDKEEKKKYKPFVLSKVAKSKDISQDVRSEAIKSIINSN